MFEENGKFRGFAIYIKDDIGSEIKMIKKLNALIRTKNVNFKIN